MTTPDLDAKALLKLALGHKPEHDGKPETSRSRDINDIAADVAAQDNRSTANPIFTVRQKNERGKELFVTCCFTAKGCEDYIAANGHNLKKPRIYVESGYRNREWEIMREFLKNLNQANA